MLSHVQQEPTPDLNPDTLSSLAAVMLAQAQESVYRKATAGEGFSMSMFVVSYVCLSVCLFSPSCVVKTLTLDTLCKLLNQILS